MLDMNPLAKSATMSDKFQDWGKKIQIWNLSLITQADNSLDTNNKKDLINYLVDETKVKTYNESELKSWLKTNNLWSDENERNKIVEDVKTAISNLKDEKWDKYNENTYFKDDSNE
jgi:hypothetical protein